MLWKPLEKVGVAVHQFLVALFGGIVDSLHFFLPCNCIVLIDNA